MPVLRGLRQALRRRLRLRMSETNILTLLFFLCLLGYLSFRTARASLRQEVYEANRVLATLAAQYDALVTNVRLLGRQLVASSVSPTLQARTMLELRRAAPLTYRALYLFDSQGEMLIHLADSLEELLAIQDVEPGLAISKRLLEANSGQIRVESTEGIGTTFTLRLPTKESP